MSASDRPDGEQTYRSMSGLVALGAVALVGIFLLGEAVVRDGWMQLLLLTPWVLIVLWAIYVVSVASMLRVDPDGVVVQNFVRRTSFGWSRVRDIDMHWQLVFTLADDRKLTCYGGPAQVRVRRSAGDGARPVPAGFRELADITELWRQGAASAEDPIRRFWDVPALVSLGVIVVWAVIALFVTQGT